MAARRQRRLLPRWVLVVLLLAVIVYHESVPAWVWTLAVGVAVVLVVYFWLGLLRRRTRYLRRRSGRR